MERGRFICTEMEATPDREQSKPQGTGCGHRDFRPGRFAELIGPRRMRAPRGRRFRPDLSRGFSRSEPLRCWSPAHAAWSRKVVASRENAPVETELAAHSMRYIPLVAERGRSIGDSGNRSGKPRSETGCHGPRIGAGGSRWGRNAPPLGVAPTDSNRPLGRCGHGNAGRIKGRIGPGRGSLRQGRCSIRFERTGDGTTTRRSSGLRVRVFGPGTVE